MKIRTEQNTLADEGTHLEKILGSESRLKTFVKKELEQDAKQFGDDRRSPIVERQEAQLLAEVEKQPSEPVTIILSTMGWTAVEEKGHEFGP